MMRTECTTCFLIFGSEKTTKAPNRKNDKEIKAIGNNRFYLFIQNYTNKTYFTLRTLMSKTTSERATSLTAASFNFISKSLSVNIADKTSNIGFSRYTSFTLVSPPTRTVLLSFQCNSLLTPFLFI